MSECHDGGHAGPGHHTLWASGFRWWRSAQEAELGLEFINAPGLELKRYGRGQQMSPRVSTRHKCSRTNVAT
jgi:hypothetical protein